MKHVMFAVGFLFTAGLAVGCTPSPEKVCNHFISLEEENAEKKKKDDDKELDPKIEKMIQKIKEKQKEQCPKQLAAMKEDSPDVYKCFSKCITGTKDYDVAKKCDEGCDGFKEAWTKARKKTEPEKDKDEDDGDKKKKSSDDEEAPKKKKKSSDEE